MRFFLFSLILAISLAIPREDIKYCGLYESKCLTDPVLSKKMVRTLNGMMHHDPVFEQREITTFWGGECSDEQKLQTITASAQLEPIRSTMTRYVYTVAYYYINFANEMAFKDYTCKEPLQVNVDYDITTLDCVDGAAQDPFAMYKAEIGVPQMTQIIYEDDESITVPMGTDDINIPRIDDTGCHY